MKKNQFIFVLIATLVSVIILSTVWEFWLESLIEGTLFDDHEEENLNERIEYIITITVFVIISLIFPAIIGFRQIEYDKKLNAKIRRLSEEDYLTGLYNRRKIHEIIETEIIRSHRYNSAFAVILIDIDDFKIVNDTYGHNIGDEVLVQFAATLKQIIRESDIASRWGGEEFLVICPETAIDGASALAEKLRSNIEKSEFKHAGNITASFGVAGVGHGDIVQSLIHRADEALYSAKKAGKNTVKAAE